MSVGGKNDAVCAFSYPDLIFSCCNSRFSKFRKTLSDTFAANLSSSLGDGKMAQSEQLSFILINYLLGIIFLLVWGHGGEGMRDCLGDLVLIFTPFLTHRARGSIGEV